MPHWHKNRERPGHGFRKLHPRTYQSWRNIQDMRGEGYDPSVPVAKRRKFPISKAWRKSFLNFLRDMGERPEGYQLRRYDPAGPYSKDNCCWVLDKRFSKKISGEVKNTPCTSPVLG